MILVRVREHHRLDRDVTALEPRHLGDIGPQSKRGFIGEHHAAIDHDRAPGAFDRHQVEADLAQPAKGHDADRRVMEVLAAIALSCLRTEANYIGHRSAAKADIHSATDAAPCLENGAGLLFEHEVAKMAASVNKVILIGNLGRDPETRFTNSGSSVTSFSIATTEPFADKAGTRQERTEWHNIMVWGKQGETCAQYLKKGSSVYIEGRITYREYEAKDGSGKRKATDIVANRVQFLSARGGAPEGDSAGDFGGGAARSRAAPAQAAAQATTSRRWTTKTSRSSPRSK